MNCPFCNTENPESAKFCRHCGKPLNEDMVGSSSEATGASVAPMTTVAAPKARLNEKKGMSEKSQKRLRLASGILMMAAVFLSLLCAFFIGVRQSVSNGSYFGSYETYTVWYYFGRAYYAVDNVLTGSNYSTYAAASYLIPTIFSTIIAAATLTATIAFTLMATVKFGLHFKRANVNYYKPATAAVFSFMLGATLFDCIHSVSTHNNYASLNASTVAGMVFCCFLIIGSLILRTISIGNGFKDKQTVLNFVCNLLCIFFLALVSGFAICEQADYSLRESTLYSNSISLYELNRILAQIYGANANVPADFTAAYVLSIFAQLTQLALHILVFIVLIRRIGNYTEGKPFSLGLAIAVTATAAAYLTFGAITVEVANSVLPASSSEYNQLWLSTEVILPFIASLLYLAVTITCRAVSKKDAAEEEKAAA